MITSEKELVSLVLNSRVFTGNEILCDGCWKRSDAVKQLALQIATERGWDITLYCPTNDEERSDGV